MLPAQKRPGSVTVAAVLLFIYATMCLVSGGMKGGIHLALGFEGFGHGPQGAIAHNSPYYKVVESTLDVMNLLMGFILILSGIGLLQLKPLAYRGARWALIVDVLLTIGHNTYQIMFTLPIMRYADFAVRDFWINMLVPTIIMLTLAVSVFKLLALNSPGNTPNDLTLPPETTIA